MPPDDKRLTPTETPAPDGPRGIVGYDPALEDELFRFQRLAYPERPVEWIAPRWRWMFLDSARRCGTAPLVWLYRGKEGISGHQGAIAVRFQVDGQQFVTGWFVETMVLESVRGRAIGPMLIKKALEDLPFNLSLGQTEPMRAIQFALGWQQVAPLPICSYLIRPERVLAGKIPNRVARALAASTLWGAGRLRQSLGRWAMSRALEVAEIDRFDDRHDQLWNQVKEGYRCAVVRDASYLNWKYVDQPAQQFVRLELSRDGRPAAVVVLMFREADEAYTYRRAFVVDVVAPLSDLGVLIAALRAAVAHCRRESDAVLLPLLNGPLQRAAAHCGFLRRPPTRFLLVATGPLPDSTRRRVLTASDWFVSLGDSDIDRPW